MEAVLSIALSNAIAATLLAVVAAVVGRLVRRPALTHGLWLLVLLKLVTPPLFRLPIYWPTERPPRASLVEESRTESGLDELRIVLVESSGQEPDSKREGEPGTLATGEAAPITHPPNSPEVPWGYLLGTLWLSGSLAWLALIWSRVRPLRGLMRYSHPAPDWLTSEVRELAGRVGLNGPPAVRLVPGKVSPMLWSLSGRPCLFLPADLLDGLDADKRVTLLVHELAHLRRRDHWVRRLEMVVGVLYWWHPVVWWARHELREAEEQCCDAWVVWALPGAGRTYAAALLDCLDFLSDAPVPTPLGASGLGHLADLKRRLTMIVTGTTPRRLTRGGLIALLGAAVLLLPWMPSWADERKEDRKEEKKEDRQEEKKADSKEIDQAKAEVEKLRDELQAQMKKTREVEEKLRAAIQKLQRAGGAREGEFRIEIIREGDRGRFVPPRVEFERRIPPRGDDRGQGPRGDDRRIQDLERRLEEMSRILQEIQRNMRGPGGGDPRRPGAREGERPGERDRRPEERRPGPREEERRPVPRREEQRDPARP